VIDEREKAKKGELVRGVSGGIEVTPQKRIQIPRLVHDVITIIDV
jgi:hypothetical protein